ncbi:hypothetical protein [Sanguibacter sp. HDW7]|uniref:hypothetical protein n=1 Tax=Sanguibacter sp. HDW7 TaxID=2714931 RepID=UPI00140AFF9B|nr:hypothetical protein [Sanguibacter sp. HDW7]QIK82291.1 hypothetical protein G7063_00665 [Sanguibacter sp. HDW7]
MRRLSGRLAVGGRDRHEVLVDVHPAVSPVELTVVLADLADDAARARCVRSIGCPAVEMVTFGPNITRLPMRISV